MRIDRHPSQIAVPARSSLLGSAALLVAIAGAVTVGDPGSALTAPSSVAVARAAGIASSPVTAAGDDEHPAASSAWRWPVGDARAVMRGFEAPEHRYGAGHRGIDIGATEGTAVNAPASGVVVFAGPVPGRSVVTVDHGGGVVSSYDPIVPSVVAGESVTPGRQIGTLGPASATHCPGCLHLGVRRNGAYIDPLPLFGPPRRSILLPLEP
jgi:murein DD-endopeptidase MepM/ murein hydrolase activator NlpD